MFVFIAARKRSFCGEQRVVFFPFYRKQNKIHIAPPHLTTHRQTHTDTHAERYKNPSSSAGVRSRVSSTVKNEC